MPVRPDQPADTTMMGVVHDALRRDLKRVQGALAAPASLPPDRRTALAGHVTWMMDFLHEHHHNEDIGLWPFVRSRNPDAAELLDSMAGDHRTIEPLISELRAAADEYRNDDRPSVAARLAGAIDSLTAPLFAHLDREEGDAMPVVSASISDRDWQRIENKHNVRGKSIPRLADEGHWLADSLDDRRYQVLVHLVPAPIRAVILKGFAGRYYRACARRWGPDLDCRPLSLRRQPATGA